MESDGNVPAAVIENFDDVEYPSLLRRYSVTLIDGLLILLIFVVLAHLLPGEGAVGPRVGLALAAFFLYEPLCTSRGSTLGQTLMGVRVRNADDLQRISVLQAYVRIVLKALFGWISFLTVGFSSRRRAIHDIAANSVVIRTPSGLAQ